MAKKIEKKLVDPLRDGLERDLLVFRKGAGHPSPERMAELFDLTEALGDGIAERAFLELERYYGEYGTDPTTDIGAYFYLSGWDVGLETVNARKDQYYKDYKKDISTSLRRSERGVTRLAALIRDHTEHSRPWCTISVFQTGSNFQAFLDFNLGYESWRPPRVWLNGEEVEDIELHLHRAEGQAPPWHESGTRYTSRTILPEVPLIQEPGRPLGVVRVEWPMPVWPTWQTIGWTVDPQIHLQTRTFRQRMVEVSVMRTPE